MKTKKNKIKFGEFLKRFFNECYPQFKKERLNSFLHLENHLKNYVADEVNQTLQEITYENNTGVELLEPVYYIFEFYKNLFLNRVLLTQLLIFKIPFISGFSKIFQNIFS